MAQLIFLTDKILEKKMNCDKSTHKNILDHLWFSPLLFFKN